MRRGRARRLVSNSGEEFVSVTRETTRDTECAGVLKENAYLCFPRTTLVCLSLVERCSTLSSALRDPPGLAGVGSGRLGRDLVFEASLGEDSALDDFSSSPSSSAFPPAGALARPLSPSLGSSSSSLLCCTWTSLGEMSTTEGEDGMSFTVCCSVTLLIGPLTIIVPPLRDKISTKMKAAAHSMARTMALLAFQPLRFLALLWPMVSYFLTPTMKSLCSPHVLAQPVDAARRGCRSTIPAKIFCETRSQLQNQSLSFARLGNFQSRQSSRRLPARLNTWIWGEMDVSRKKPRPRCHLGQIFTC